jgi:Flp pilus assembly protein TadD
LTIRLPAHAATLSVLLMVNGCASVMSSRYSANKPGVNVGEAALQGGAGEVALQVADGILRDSPDNTTAREIKADALTLLGQYDQASVAYMALLAKDPNLVRANIGLGRIRLASDPAEAERLFQNVLRQEPKNLTALNNLGIARDLQGRHAEAQVAYHRALAIAPDQPSTEVNLALSLAMSGHGPEAISLLRARANEPGAAPKIRHDYAVVLALSGHREEAATILGETMNPSEVRQALDGVTGSQSATIHSLAPSLNDQSEIARAAINQPLPEAQAYAVPPDVIQPIPPPSGFGPGVLGSNVPPPSPPVVVQPWIAPGQSVSATNHAVDAASAVMTSPIPPSMARAMAAQGGAPDVGQGPGQITHTIVPAVIPMPSPTAPTIAGPPPATAFLPAARIAPPRVSPVAVAEAPATPPTPLPGKSPTVTTQPPARAVAVLHAAKAPSAPVTAASSDQTTARSAADAPTIMMADAVPSTPLTSRTAVIADPAADSALVQLVAAPSETAAEGEWRNLVHRFPDLLGHREPIVIRVDLGGRIYWRLRTGGFASTAEARAVCSHLHALRQDCFVPRS